MSDAVTKVLQHFGATSVIISSGVTRVTWQRRELQHCCDEMRVSIDKVVEHVNLQ